MRSVALEGSWRGRVVGWVVGVRNNLFSLGFVVRMVLVRSVAWWAASSDIRGT